MPVPNEQIRQIILDNKIYSVADVYALLRDNLKDILQELMEAEKDAIVLQCSGGKSGKTACGNTLAITETNIVRKSWQVQAITGHHYSKADPKLLLLIYG